MNTLQSRYKASPNARLFTCFIFAPGVRIFARRVIRVTLRPLVSCRSCHVVFLSTLPSALSREKNSYICPQRHQFDMAKKGMSICCPFSINGLVIRATRGNDASTPRILRCRTLSAAADAIVAQLRERLDEKATAVLVLAVVKGITHTHLPMRCPKSHVWPGCLEGSDKSGGETLSAVTFCVASSHRLPFSDTSMDA